MSSKDTTAIIEIDRVMLDAGAHWPDDEADAMVVRHVKWMTRIINEDIAATLTLRKSAREAWLTGTPDFRRHYDEALFKVMGVGSFQELWPG